MQRLVPARAAGVLFTADPTTGRRDQCLISAAWGLGEAVVQGEVTTDDLVVTGAAVTSRRTADKAVRTVLTPRGTVNEPVPAELRRTPVLTDEQALELAALGRRVARHAGVPQDLEWVLTDAGGFVLVQSRPITALPEEPGPVPTDWPVPDRWAMYVRASIVEQLPDPLTPLFADLAAEAVPTGLERMIEANLGDFDAVRSDDLSFPTINGYAYYAYPARVMGRYLALTPKLLPTIMGSGRRPGGFGPDHWRTVVHPEYQRLAASWRERELTGATAASLVASARELLLAGCSYYATVQTVIPVVIMAESLFTAWYRFIGRRGDPEATTFLLGGDSEPIRAERTLWSIAQVVRDDPALRDAFARGPVTLDERPDGVDAAVWATFVERFRAYLDAFGHAVFNLDFSQSLAADDPGPVLDTLRFAVRGDGQDPSVRQRRMLEARQAAVDAVRPRLGPIRRRVFDRLLAHAQAVGPIREDALADVGLVWPAIRRILRELGGRLVAAGALATADDVFWLHRDELLDLAERLDAGMPVSDRSAAVLERRRIWRGQALATPPGILPTTSIWHMFDRVMPTRTGTSTGSVLHGTGTGGGRVTAVARVIRGPADFPTLEAGDVLVAAITTPAWTPLFARAGAVVTDVGGPLSHSSIVAREYGIPAVLGTGVATDRIRTGDRIVVDGAAGTVTWADGAAEALTAPHAGERAGSARRRLAVVAAAVGAVALAAVTVTVLRRRRSSSR